MGSSCSSSSLSTLSPASRLWSDAQFSGSALKFSAGSLVIPLAQHIWAGRSPVARSPDREQHVAVAEPGYPAVRREPAIGHAAGEFQPQHRLEVFPGPELPAAHHPGSGSTPITAAASAA